MGRIIHGHHKRGQTSPEYRAWAHAIGRCTKVKDSSYARYGGRGIYVCKRWMESFTSFLADMGLRPSPLHTLERKDGDGPYSPDNCKWATMIEQSNNRVSNRRIEYGGETLNVKQWAERFKINRKTLISRLNRGWSLEQAFK